MAIAPALLTTDAQYVELADQVAKMIAPSRGMADGWRSNCLFEFLAGTEGHLLAGLDLDRFAGRRIAAHAGGTIPHLQNPKSNDLHALAHCQVLVIMPMRSSIIFTACVLLS